MEREWRLPRWDTMKSVKVWMPRTEGINNCVVVDINLKGMRVSFSKRLPDEKFVDMAFSISDYFDPVKIEARILWEREEQNRFIYGVTFNKIDDHDKDRIEKYLNTEHYDQFRDKWWA